MDAGGNGETLAEETADKFGHSHVHQVKLTRAWYGAWMYFCTSAPVPVTLSCSNRKPNCASRPAMIWLMFASFFQGVLGLFACIIAIKLMEMFKEGEPANARRPMAFTEVYLGEVTRDDFR